MLLLQAFRLRVLFLVVTSGELQMALQSTLESRDTDACEIGDGVAIETISEETNLNLTNGRKSNSTSKSFKSTDDDLSNLNPVKLGSSEEISPSSTKVTDSTSKCPSMPIPRSKSPDMTKLSRSFNSSASPEVPKLFSVENPTKSSPKTDMSFSVGDSVATSTDLYSVRNKNGSSIPIADSLDETKFVLLHLILSRLLSN